MSRERTSSARVGLARRLAPRLHDPGAVGAMVIGSAARNVATDDSDLDLLAVPGPDAHQPPFPRLVEQETLVEVVAKTEAQWVQHLESARPRWIYALLDGGDVLVDDATVRRLQSLAAEVFARFVTPADVRSEIAALLWHGRVKTARAASSGDDPAAAFSAALLLPDLMDGLLALHNRPSVPGASRLEVLAGVHLGRRDSELIQQAMVAAPTTRLRAARELAASLERRLGPPDLERVAW